MKKNKFVVKTADKAHWPLSDRDLWLRIAAHSFEDPGHHQTFAARLARDHAWSLDHARRAIEEYRRFCFLAIVSPTQMTPSEEVDEVWHQHLTYTRDYWEVWCGEALGRPLHHQPTKGGSGEGARFAAQYAETLARYEERFGPPPEEFWPGTAERFGRGARFRIVDRDRLVAVPAPRALARLLRRLVAVAVAGLAVAFLTPCPAVAGLGLLDWPGAAFLRLYVALAAIAAFGAVGHHVLVRLRASDRAIGWTDFTPDELALLAGGRERAADLVALQMMQAGRLQITGTEIKVLPRPAHAGRGAADILLRHGTIFTRARLAEIVGPSLRPAWERLARDGWAISPDEAASIKRVTLALLGSVALFGLAKLVIGHSRDKPVGFLILITIVMLIVGLVGGLPRSLSSTAGLFRLRDYREENARALRAPLAGEVLIAFALMGPAALAGTPLAAYAGTMPKSDGGSGCGGGDGGGGCGGCGGG